MSKIFKKKIIWIVSFTTLLVVGGFFLFLKPPVQEIKTPERNFIVAKALGGVEYPFDLPFQKGVLLEKIVESFSPLSRTYEVEVKDGAFHKQSLSNKIEKDISFRVSLRKN